MVRNINREPLVFCMRRCTCKKYKIDVKGHQSGAPYFCMWHYACKKNKIDVKGYQSEAPFFLYAALRV
jgi:hypothetical protein